MAILFASLLIAATGFAQSIWHVSGDYDTLQEAEIAAAPGDTIVLEAGEHCGILLTKPLTITGADDATSRIVVCPGVSVIYPFSPKTMYVGFWIRPEASGSTIEHLTFDGSGWSPDNDELALGIVSPFYVSLDPHSANDLVIQHNRFAGGIGGISLRGERNTISHNVFDGYSIDPDTSIGGWGIDLVSINTWAAQTLGFPLFAADDNLVMHNKFSTTGPDRTVLSWLSADPGLMFVGVATADQSNMLVRNNKFAIASSSTGDSYGAGFLFSDELSGGASVSQDLMVVNNDGRKSEYMLIITRDVGGGTDNTRGAVLRGNFGVNDVNEVASDVANRSIKTLVECDVDGDCQ